MGSGKQKQRPVLAAKPLEKKHKKRLHLGPKKSGVITGSDADKTKFKRMKKKKKTKALITSVETESKNNDNHRNIETANFEKKKQKKNKKKKEKEEKSGNDSVLQQPTASQQLRYFLHQYQSANGIQLSALELDSFKDACMLELCQSTAQNISSLSEHMKAAFGSPWEEVLCEKHLREGKVDPGNPALLVISLSALRSLELLRELRDLTRECHAVKLFSKHMKIEEQVSFLKNRVNIACGTPSRIKKLIDMDALGLSRLAVIVLDMYTDVKGYSLLTLPQVRDEFWDLYKSYFHNRLLEGHLRICLYGRTPEIPEATTEPRDN